MQVVKTSIKDLLEITPAVYRDDRGWFMEFYKEDAFLPAGITYRFTQENLSFSKKGVVRGLHFQLAPYEQAKLVSVLTGKVLDVVVDLRRGSETFGQVYTCMLDSEKRNMLMVPEGFAHGFAALEDSLFLYKTSNAYNRESECGIVWNDPTLAIDWPIDNPVLSDKDRKLPTFNELLGKSLISRD
ncbi:MAG: dTDP-4-dehydrorhamnose 3,5-epimerase [Cyclobacteriaceae bacterium]|nr:dTDP-4-dehydrorhamnose 3,5-epimerase [Cyclobacteriaceae bacterium]UYN87499.1 MAG: dTDP-4-dehydrorhamnose 3,5-epimerase [Cyclobacteriaceae bacterium]